MAAWPEERRAVVEDMVVFIRTSETAGLLTDLNEDSCYSCNCSGAWVSAWLGARRLCG